MITKLEKINAQKVTDLADKSLLIVDDDNPLRERLARAMEKKGFKVAQADAGTEKEIIQDEIEQLKLVMKRYEEDEEYEKAAVIKKRINYLNRYL